MRYFALFVFLFCLVLVSCYDMHNVDVLYIENNYYPVSQFIKAGSDRCDSEHWHAHGKVYAIYSEYQLDMEYKADNIGIVDPDPTGCGFGKTSELTVLHIQVPQEQYRMYRDAPIKVTDE